MTEQTLDATCGCRLVVLVDDRGWKPVRLERGDCHKLHGATTKGAMVARAFLYLIADQAFGRRAPC